AGRAPFTDEASGDELADQAADRTPGEAGPRDEAGSRHRPAGVELADDGAEVRPPDRLAPQPGLVTNGGHEVCVPPAQIGQTVPRRSAAAAPVHGAVEAANPSASAGGQHGGGQVRPQAGERTAKLRWGILGPGRIAPRIARALADNERGELLAVASRDPERGRAFAERHGAQTVHDTYEALLADPSIDVVYVALPNGLHAEWTVRALDAGKHVLCEKPLALTV